MDRQIAESPPEAPPEGAVSKVAVQPKEFRYHDHISKIACCPGSANELFEENNFRAVQKDIKFKNNFLPQAVYEPQRLLKCKPGAKCSLWGLSTYESVEGLRNLILKVEETTPNFRKKIGDHYAKLRLSSEVGRRTASDKFGHFDFYEYTNFDAQKSVIEHAPLFP